MNLPFTAEQFFEVMASYNIDVYPMQFFLYLLVAFLLYFSIKPHSKGNRYISCILAFFWLWMGVVYHLMYFTGINKAAYLFGSAFILEGLLILFAGLIQGSLQFRYKSDKYGITGAALIVFACLVYPLLNIRFGHLYPRSPTFGLPCPTTIFTFGVFLWTTGRFPVWLLIIPLLWSAIGVSAALTLGVWEDLGIVVAGLISTALLIMRNKVSAAERF